MKPVPHGSLAAVDIVAVGMGDSAGVQMCAVLAGNVDMPVCSLHTCTAVFY